jgi:hypothetical protein
MPEDPKIPVYANTMGMQISEKDVILTFAMRMGESDEDVVVVARVVLARSFWETTVPWMQEQLVPISGKVKEIDQQ